MDEFLPVVVLCIDFRVARRIELEPMTRSTRVAVYLVAPVFAITDLIEIAAGRDPGKGHIREGREEVGRQSARCS